MQSTTSPLDQLADIHLPESLSWWPLAPGWWALIVLFIITAAGIYIWRRKKAQNFYRIIAQHQLTGIYAEFQQTQNTGAYLQAINLLLRRTAITAYPHNFNASIKGTAWLNWLDAVCPALPQQFSSELGQTLVTSAYQKNPQVDAAALYQLSEQWIKLHRNHRQKLAAKKTTEANHV